MDFLRYARRVVVLACRPSLDVAQAIVFVLLIALGLSGSLFPGLAPKWLPDPTGWRMAGYALVSAICARFLLAPFWAWEEQRAAAEKARTDLASLRASPDFIRATPAYARLRLMLGPETIWSPESRLAASLAEFRRLHMEAERGSVEAVFLATAVAEWLRDSGRAYYASSTKYAEIEQTMFDVLDKLHATLPSTQRGPAPRLPSPRRRQP